MCVPSLRWMLKWMSHLLALAGGCQRSYGVLHEQSARHRRHPDQIKNTCSNLHGALHMKEEEEKEKEEKKVQRLSVHLRKKKSTQVFIPEHKLQFSVHTEIFNFNFPPYFPPISAIFLRICEGYNVPAKPRKCTIHKYRYLVLMGKRRLVSQVRLSVGGKYMNNEKGTR